MKIRIKSTYLGNRSSESLTDLAPTVAWSHWMVKYGPWRLLPLNTNLTQHLPANEPEEWCSGIPHQTDKHFQILNLKSQERKLQKEKN